MQNGIAGTEIVKHSVFFEKFHCFSSAKPFFRAVCLEAKYLKSQSFTHFYTSKI